MKMICTILLVFTSGLIFAQVQTATVPITDISSSQHLISFSGSVDFSEQLTGRRRTYKEHGSVIGRNVTNKNVMALVAMIKAVGFRGPGTEQLYRHDFFFKDHGLGPGDSFDIPIETNMTTEPFNLTLIKSHADAELLFVQFDDGSTWGDSTIGDAVTGQRGDVVVYLNRLLTTYTEQGEGAFVAALQERPKGPPSAFAVGQHLLDLYNQFGTASAIENIKTRLKIAADRNVSGKF